MFEEMCVRICVLGAGALGCTFGAALSEAGHDTWLLNPEGAHLEALQRDGLRVDDARGSRQVKVRARSRAHEIGVVDLVVVLVKSFHTAEAMRAALPLLGPATLVLSLQNGMGHEDILAGIVGPQRVLAGKTYVGGVLRAPGHILSGVAGKHTVIGELDGQPSLRVRCVADAFNTAGLETRVSPDIRATLWDKLLVNVATGALAAITGLNYGQLYSLPELREVALAAVAEAMAVARAAGVTFSMEDPLEAWSLAAEGLAPDFRTSMLQSLERGSPTEIDFINGAVVRQGGRHGIATPVNACLVACVKGLERAQADRRQAEGGC
jgi:2-dehydropantoate 2-reductase